MDVVRRVIVLRGKVGTGEVHAFMVSRVPHTAVRDIVDAAVVGHVGRATVLAVERLQILERELLIETPSARDRFTRDTYPDDTKDDAGGSSG